MEVLRAAAGMIFGLSSGFVVAGAVFAFINILGIVPKMAKRTGTETSVCVYEQLIIAGGVIGTLLGIFDWKQPFGHAAGNVMLLIMGLASGIFTGALAMCLAEVLDVIPILARRARIRRGLAVYILCIAAGKLTGSLMYFIGGGFHD